MLISLSGGKAGCPAGNNHFIFVFAPSRLRDSLDYERRPAILRPQISANAPKPASANVAGSGTAT